MVHFNVLGTHRLELVLFSSFLLEDDAVTSRLGATWFGLAGRHVATL
jgi:hypothetical protein